ncbi:MAG: HAMP domain-containing histidine kinase [Clostridiales bacterium]|nr:HAMP domain-containing histidine kinase [Clostridiales bacterium]
MFKKLQFKMTVYYTFILIGILVAINMSIYFLMVNYNNYQIASEIKFMLESIQSSEWLYETEPSDTLDSSISPQSIFLSYSDNDILDDNETNETDETDEIDEIDERDEIDDDYNKIDNSTNDNELNGVSDDNNELNDDSEVETEGSEMDDSEPNEIELPETKDLLIPRILESFPYYMIYDNDEQVVQWKSEDENIFEALMFKSTSINVSETPTVVELDSVTSSHYLIAKMPILINGQLLGSYVVIKDVTLVFETLDNLVKILIYSFIGGVIVSLGLGYLLAGKSIKPIKKAYDSKQEFLANASHELKTPLSIIMLSTETLEGEIKQSELFQRKVVSGIKEESIKMNELVSNLLYLSRRDNQYIVSAKENLNLSELLLKEVSKFRQIAEIKEIAIDDRVQGNIMFNGDQKLLASAFGILIDNAVKYTKEHGRVLINMESTAVLKKQKIIIEIIDTGVGIPESELNNIFDRFYRLDSSRSKETGGHGLGLSIAKEIIEEHSGTISVDSTEDVGTKFIVEFFT